MCMCACVNDVFVHEFRVKELPNNFPPITITFLFSLFSQVSAKQQPPVHIQSRLQGPAQFKEAVSTLLTSSMMLISPEPTMWVLFSVKTLSVSSVFLVNVSNYKLQITRFMFKLQWDNLRVYLSVIVYQSNKPTF